MQGDAVSASFPLAIWKDATPESPEYWALVLFRWMLRGNLHWNWRLV